MSGMIGLIEQHRPRLLELCRQYDVRRLDLFGSALRADYAPERSYLDFVVEFNNFTVDTAADRYLGLIFDLEDLFGGRIDLLSDPAIRNPYFKRIVDNTGVPLYAA